MNFALSSPWIAVALSLVLFALYELRVWFVARRRPQALARTAHARMRVAWVRLLSEKDGFEIVAVQALRNSLMSATIAASTAALALMASVSLAGLNVASTIGQLDLHAGVPVRIALEGLLMAVLFASYVCSAMAMRYFNHAGFVMSMPCRSAERQRLNPVASDYVERAGLLYSWGLRFFMMVAPVVAGIATPWAMPPMTLALVAVLGFFDKSSEAGLD